MPELPEGETVRRGLARSIVGRRVASARLLRRDVLRTASRSGQAALLAESTIKEVLRRGKHLAVVAEDGRALGVHLGMTGQLLVAPIGKPQAARDHVHARWVFDNGSTLIFRDPRRFGGLWSYATLDALRTARWAGLGADALHVTARQLELGLAGGRRAVKAALLDQGVLAGVGNIYADEALFRAGLHPCRVAGSLTDPEVSRLAESIRCVLREAVRAGGSTIRDYAGSDGSPGRQQERHLVYGRGGQPCVHCGTLLTAFLVAQRTTVACPRCQRLPKSYSHSPSAHRTLAGVDRKRRTEREGISSEEMNS